LLHESITFRGRVTQSSDPMLNLSKLYRFRFREAERAGKTRIWKLLCARFFQPLIGEDRVIVDLACGYGEFINNIRGRKTYAVDLNPDARAHLAPEVEFCLARAGHRARISVRSAGAVAGCTASVAPTAAAAARSCAGEDQ